MSVKSGSAKELLEKGEHSLNCLRVNVGSEKLMADVVF
jgi:hypothetical protein